MAKHKYWYSTGFNPQSSALTTEPPDYWQPTYGSSTNSVINAKALLPKELHLMH